MQRFIFVLTLLSALFLSTSVLADKPDRSMPAESNKQSLHGSTKGLDRAAERRSEQGAAHAQSGGQRYDGADYDGDPESLADLIDDEADKIRRQVGLDDELDLEDDLRHDRDRQQKKAGKQTRESDNEQGFFRRMWPFGASD